MMEQIEFCRRDLNGGQDLCLYGGKPGSKLRGQWLPAPERRLKVLNMSGGKQSSMLAWLAIRGEIERPDVIMTANPGMEGQQVNDYVQLIHAEAHKAGIPAYTVEGPNLYEGLLKFKERGATRFDLPAYYVKNPDGSTGKLLQRCTTWSKVRPMNRAARMELEQRLGIKRTSNWVPPGTVERWIGFSASEVHRIKPPLETWVCFKFPLVDMGITNGGVVKWYQRTGTPMPPRSVCRACFANDAAFFQTMYETDRPGWEQAVAVDETIRDCRQLGIKHPVYILRSCISLKELQARNFVDPGQGNPKDSCDSGHCML